MSAAPVESEDGGTGSERPPAGGARAGGCMFICTAAGFSRDTGKASAVAELITTETVRDIPRLERSEVGGSEGFHFMSI